MKYLILILSVMVGACAVPATPAGDIKTHKTQYGMIHRVSIDSTYGVVCYATSNDSIVYIDNNYHLSCVYSPRINP